MEKKFIMSLDSGTTSCRTIVFDHHAKPVSIAQTEFNQIYPKSGWVEHDALEIWNAQLFTIQSAKNKAKIKSPQIASVGITNQRETVVLWNKETGLPVYNAIVWQDRRTASYCEKLLQENPQVSEMIKQKTGLLINPYFSATKIKWILENVETAQKTLAENKLLAGTIDTWLAWKLTEGKSFVTDVTNASRTMLFNITTLDWDQELLDLFGIPRQILPEVKNSADHFGIINPHVFSQRSNAQVPINSMIGDQQSALFGHMCLEAGQVKNTYGTGCFSLVNTGENKVLSNHKLLTTIAWKFPDHKPIYALEGSVFIGGAALKWLKEGLKILYDAAESDFYSSLAQKNEKNQGQIYVVPSFTGLGAPYWDSSSRGAIFGLERQTKREHIVKATLESIAYQTEDLLSAMASDMGKKITTMKVDGGAANSKYLMQFQASISDLEVVKPSSTEVTAQGAAFMAGLFAGYWKSTDEIKELLLVDKKYLPQMPARKVAFLKKGWKVAVSKTFNWVNDLGEIDD